MKFFSIIAACLASLLLAATAGAADRGAAAILPSQFGGWEIQGAAKSSKDPGVADPVNAPVLKEYGFSDFQSASYARDDGRKLTVRAARFQDTSGAYGAFTFYKEPEMLNEKIGDQASSLNNRVLFYRGNVLVDAVFDKLTAMSAAELRELAAVLPVPAEGSKLPGLPAYLPKQAYVKNTAKYVLGPAALNKIGAPVPSSLVDFASGAEAVLGKYSSSGGEATLLLVNYPTPQIAAEHLRKIEAAQQQSANQAAKPGLQADSGPFFSKRTGPIVVVAAGPLSQSDGKSLLAAVNYDADVTWNENTGLSKRNNLANLLVNIIILCFILIGFALVAGLAFGGLRILVKRLFPDRVFDRPDEMEFISLHLSERLNEPPSSR